MRIFAALEFLTVLRLRRGPAASLPEIAASQAWFPVVGLLIGALLVAIDRLAIRALPAASVDVLLVVALAAITGALHFDGLGDAADGLFGGNSRERRLEIMHDVHAGSFSIVAIGSILAMKWAGLAALPSHVRAEAILATPCLARFGMVAAVAAFPYARPQGLGLEFHRTAWPLAVVAGAIVALVVSGGMFGAGGGAIVALAAGCSLAVGAYASRLIGGLTGDVYGAIVEITEAALFLAIAASANRGWLDAWALR